MIFFRVFRHLIDLCIMSILVTIVEIIVLIHSDNYMFRDQGYLRFFTYMGFLNASMLVLVTNSNLTQIYIFLGTSWTVSIFIDNFLFAHLL